MTRQPPTPCALKTPTRQLWMASFLTVLAGAAQAQRDSVTLSGVVVDSATGSPIVAVSVLLDDRETPTLTDVSGRFAIPGVGIGDHVVRFTRIGFTTRALMIRVAEPDATMGFVLLAARPSRRITVSGTVREEATAEPVPRATVMVNDVMVAVTTADGVFRATGVNVYDTENHLVVFVQGYQPVEQTFVVPTPQEELSANVLLGRLPTQLEPVVVEATELPPHLRDFERRRKSALGRYITANEIERLNPPAATDVLRRVPGVVVTGEPSTGTSVRFFRSGGFCVEAPLIFLDGVFTPNLIIDAVLAPERIAGIELYSGPASIPPEFNIPGSGLTGGTRASCGVIAFWTKAPDLARRHSPFEIGARYGGAVGSDRAGSARLGVHMVTPLLGPLELYPAFALSTGLTVSNRGIQSSLWFAQLALRVRPLGAETPWYVGSGLTLSKPSLKVENAPANFPNAPDVDPAHTLFTGFSYPFGPARPFIEIHGLDVLGFSTPTAEMFAGVGVKF